MRSTQSKIYIGVHGLTIAAGAYLCAKIGGEIPKEARNQKIRFWTKYVQVITINVIIAAIAAYATDALSKSGYTILSWLMILLPFTYVCYSSYLLLGVDTILENTSGRTSIGLIKPAYR